MKIIALIFSLMFPFQLVVAQEMLPPLTLNQAIPAGTVSNQNAAGSISTRSRIERGGQAHYVAGTGIHLQSGFLAQAGAVFSATLAPSPAFGSAEASPRLTARAYPNPFVEQTTVDYSLPAAGLIHQTLTDLNGSILRQSTQEMAAGQHRAKIDGVSFPAGVYFYQLQVGNEIRTLRIIKK